MDGKGLLVLVVIGGLLLAGLTIDLLMFGMLRSWGWLP